MQAEEPERRKQAKQRRAPAWTLDAVVSADGDDGDNERNRGDQDVLPNPGGVT